MVIKPKRISTQSAPKRYGIHEVKSYLVWQANRLRKTKIPSVKIKACSTILLS
jgi:hypothetical protein